MKRKKWKIFRPYQKILTYLCMVLVGVLFFGVSIRVHGAYGTTDKETHNNATQKLGSYNTSAYRVPYKDANGNETWVDVPAIKSEQKQGNKTVTTNTLDWDYLFSQMDVASNPNILDQFVKEIDGQKIYGVDATVIFEVVVDNKGGTDYYVGEDLLDAPDRWGGSYSAATKKNVLDDKDSIAYVDFGKPIPTPTPPPTPTLPPPITVGPTKTPEPDLPDPVDPDDPVVPEPDPEDIPEPSPSPEPTKKPRPTDAPTPTPASIEIRRTYEYYNYCTTRNASSISNIAVNGSIADDTDVSAISLVNALANVGYRYSYAVGTDESGNEWYFLASSSTSSISGLGSVYTATSVHPKKYNGYAVESKNIRFISELTFPEYILLNGRKYYVTSVGGSGPYYYGNPGTFPEGTVSGNLGKISGSYSWEVYKNSCGFTYLLGVVGNGTITSYGNGYNSGSDGYNYIRYIDTFKNNYYVYNTTLGSITLPQYCTTVEDYAFHNCQGLVVIDAPNLTTIGKHAFSVAEPPALKRSIIRKTEGWIGGTETGITSDTKIMYYYDGSYEDDYKADLKESLGWFQERVWIGEYMAFPDLPKLITIGESAFENRNHLVTVELSNTVKTVDSNAFKNCLLEYITVPNYDTQIKGNYHTLGTKGKDVAIKTIIFTPNVDYSYPVRYGTSFSDYYRILQEAYVYYYPNGGTPDEVQQEMAEIKYLSPTMTEYVIPACSDTDTAVAWLGTEGYIYTGKVTTKTIRGVKRFFLSGTVDRNGAQYKYTRLEVLAGTGNGSVTCFVAYGEDDNRYLYSIQKNGKLSFLGEFNLPSEIASIISVTYRSFTSSIDGVSAQRMGPEIYFKGADQRYHKYTSQTRSCVSETPFPVGLTSIKLKLETGTSTGTYNRAVLTTGGALFLKAGFDKPWVRVTGYVYYRDGSYYTKGYYDVTSVQSIKYYGSTVYAQVTAKHRTGGYVKTFVTSAQTKWDSETQTYSAYFGQSPADDARIEHIGAFPSGTSYTSSASASGALLCENNGYKVYNNGGQIVYSRNGQVVSLGEGQFITTSYDLDNGTFYVYTLDKNGYIRRNGSAMSSLKFKRCVPLSYKGAFSGSGSNSNSTASMMALDTNGYLWYCYGGGFYKYSDKIYKDIIGTTSTKSESVNNNYIDENGAFQSEWVSTTERLYYWLYMIDGNGDLEYMSRQVYVDVTSVNGGNWYSTNSNVLEFTKKDYEEEAAYFVGFPFFIYENGMAGSVAADRDLEYDTFCGVEATYTIAPNRWFAYQDGYEFTHWNEKADNSGTTHDPYTSFTKTIYNANWESSASDLKLYAQWDVYKPKPKHVVYNPNGGYGTMEDTIIPADSNQGIVSDCLFDRPGYTYAGYWTTNPDGTGEQYKPGDTIITEVDILLHAQWIPNTYDVEWAYDDISITPVKIFDRLDDVRFDQSFAMPDAPYIKQCYVDYVLKTTESMSSAADARWVTELPLSDEYTTSKQEFTGWDKYYYRDGKYIFGYDRFGVWEDVSGLSTIKDDTVTMFPVWGGVGGYVILPEVACRGYELTGWMNASEYEEATEVAYYVPENGGGLYLPVKDETLYSLWSPKQFVVQLEAPDATTHTQTSVVMTFDQLGPNVGPPEREEYGFRGYYTEPDGQGEKYYNRRGECVKVWTTDNDVDDEKITVLYACWGPEEYEIILDGRGATYMPQDSVIVVYEEVPPDVLTPEKTGYTFHGYYTEIRGQGKKYFNADGTATGPWVDLDVDILYAYWTQDPIEMPEEDDYKEPERLPEEVVEGYVIKRDSKVLIYADDYDASTGALTDLQPYLAYDMNGVEGAIPSTEQLSLRARMGSWALEYCFHKYTGKDMVKYAVTVPYRTQYELENENLVISDVQYATYEMMVPKAWSYWAVEKSGLFYPETLLVENVLLDDGKLEIKVDTEMEAAVQTPEYEVAQYGGKESHVTWGDSDAEGIPCIAIALEEEEYIISDALGMAPDIRTYLRIVCQNAAWADDTQAQVRSDLFLFGEEKLLDDTYSNTGNGAELKEEKLPKDEDADKILYTSYLQTYESGIIPDAFAQNGIYNSTAKIRYKGDECNTGVQDSIELKVNDINSVRIHTPVVCNGIVSADRKEEEYTVTLELREILNFFTVEIQNKGTHRTSLGYGTKDFSMALSGASNIAMDEVEVLNQVRFPFPVIWDREKNTEAMKNFSDDEYIDSGSWVTIGKGQNMFYIPVTQKNGQYEIEFRTIAVNCPYTEAGERNTDLCQNTANINPDNYVAQDVQKVEIVSYLDDFLITSAEDREAMVKLLDGQQALTMKKGYGFQYALYSQGEFYGNDAEITIIPTFYWGSYNGKERKKAELYVRKYEFVEGERDFRDLFIENLPTDACNVCDKVYLDDETKCNHYLKSTGIRELKDLILQSWKGEFYLPEGILCVTEDKKEEFLSASINQTFSGREDFFQKDGYLIIHFDIEVISNQGKKYTFSNWGNTKLKKDALAAGWNYMPGDVIRYDLAESIEEDYERGNLE